MKYKTMKQRGMIQGAMMGLVSIALAFFNSYLIKEASTGDFRISWHLAVKGGGGGGGWGPAIIRGIFGANSGFWVG